MFLGSLTFCPCRCAIDRNPIIFISHQNTTFISIKSNFLLASTSTRSSSSGCFCIIPFSRATVCSMHWYRRRIYVKKGNIFPIYPMKAQKGGQIYSSIHSESRLWMEVSSLLHAPAALLRERTLVPIEMEDLLAVWKFW